MKSRNVKKYINNAISNSVPDVLDNIIEKCDIKRGFNMNDKKIVESEKKNKFFLTPKFIGGACAAVLLLGIIGFTGVNQYNRKYAIDSVIELDVNPSIELNVNKEKDIISAIALNDDAKKILKDMDLKDVDLNVAVNAIIGSMMKNGYLTIDQNSILVSVKNKDSKESEKLQQDITKEINDLLKASKIEGAILTQEFDNTDKNVEKLSSEYGISEGKVKLINNVLSSKVKNSKGEIYTFEQLAGLSINELNLLLSEKKVQVNNVSTTGTANQSGLIGKEKAKSIAINDANTTESKVNGLEIEIDTERGIIVYEVEFSVGYKEYDYDINAKTGEIIFEKVDIDADPDDYVSKDNNLNNNSNNNSYIGKEKAKSIAFKDAGVKESNVYEVEVEFDKDDGVYSYEIEFKSGNKEYSYDIDAKSGKILERDIERD